MRLPRQFHYLLVDEEAFAQISRAYATRFVLNSLRTMLFRCCKYAYFGCMKFWQPTIPYDSLQISFNAVLIWEFVWIVSGANANHDLSQTESHLYKFVFTDCSNGCNRKIESITKSFSWSLWVWFIFFSNRIFHHVFSLHSFFSTISRSEILIQITILWPNEFDQTLSRSFRLLTIFATAIRSLPSGIATNRKLSFFRNCMFDLDAFECGMEILLLKWSCLTEAVSNILNICLSYSISINGRDLMRKN